MTATADAHADYYLYETDVAVTEHVLDAKRQLGRAQRNVLDAVIAAEFHGTWERDGCRDLAHWLAVKLGISAWTARRWINAAHTLAHLPDTDVALVDGRLSLEKTVELCRFATQHDEARLIAWAQRVSVTAVRRRADEETRVDQDETRAHQRERYLSYSWVDEGRNLALQGCLAADQGAVVAKALDRAADRIPDVIADEHDEARRAHLDPLDARRADALYAFCSRAIAQDTDADRATVVLHTDTDALCDEGAHGSALDQGGVVDPATVMRMTCDCRIQVVRHDRYGTITGVGDTQRLVPRRLLRALQRRDSGCCTFPGCHARMFLHAHHIWHWGLGGPTDLDNLTLMCVFHHRLVHEFRWRVALGPPGVTRWFRPDGTEFEPQRAPPTTTVLDDPTTKDEIPTQAEQLVLEQVRAA